ncbi:Zn(II)2Cys6 transcription factor [Aspergillus novofumigatus IBT 16806]|uniref:Zn(2)-C6 fungal-type domain-containing protein n=1 Tax=Aspergillus novofumigatus (strain IBT 16806) TaxID=1392255 RepID=A0A2I1BYY8_ASPN1|nr:uncharacterized protein P174DRAFT_514633 [Aspergillus novofumigatus IBT 16806]PKX90587.1 hypothetical protein P174DRAFT_514633 [Aspergillus novofumigatus IBT 16806]
MDQNYLVYDRGNLNPVPGWWLGRQEENLATAQTGHSKAEKPQPKRRIRPHNKSRRGCLNCKIRRVKCPENHPACENCRGKDLVCVYPAGLQNDVQYLGDPARNVSSQLAYLQPRRQAGEFTIADMCLLQHFITDAHPHLPVGNDDIYTRALPALTYQKHEYVMHAILALSSSHLALLTGSALPVEALRHRQRALRGLNEAMSRAPSETSDADAMLAACYILTFQSSYMLDGLSEYIMMLRGCGLVTGLMLQRNLHGSFSIDVNSHIKYMEAQSDRFPTIDSRIASDGIRSLSLVKPLLQHPIEEVFYQLLFDFITLPQCEVHHLLDPEKQISQVLMAHFLILLAILSPITSLEATNRLRNVPMAGMLSWVANICTQMSGRKAERYLMWPKSVVETIRANTSRTGVLVGDVLVLILNFPDRLLLPQHDIAR